MRLICPQCNALYDVSSEMIPPEGREVECSACGHVWHQPADIWAVTAVRSSHSAKVRACVAFLREQLASGPYSLSGS